MDAKQMYELKGTGSQQTS